MICTGGMLKSTAGVGYRKLGWETGAEHQGQQPKPVCVVGTLRRRSFSLNTREKPPKAPTWSTSGSHIGDLSKENALGESML